MATYSNGTDKNIVAIVQARMSSTRLPGKVLKDVGGRTVLERVIRRLERCASLTSIVVATTTQSVDDAIVLSCIDLNVTCTRGSEQDVLDRYYQTAKKVKAAYVVRITSDCPLVDPELVDHTVELFFEQRADYASNSITRSYPQGLDTEVFSFSALERAWKEAARDYEREHVTPYFYEHPGLFRIASLTNPIDFSHHRWTLDTAEDLSLVRELYSRLGSRDYFSWQEALVAAEREPALARLNSHIPQKHYTHAG